MTKDFIVEKFQEIQNIIVNELQLLDGLIFFQTDIWEREAGGGGRTKTGKDGDVIEKGGVAFSAVHGEVTEIMKKQLQLDGESFLATGISIVLHPSNPFVPIIHMNVRYFELNDGTYWFGGGIDLTPHYIQRSQAQVFHSRLKFICDKYNPDFYPKFKVWADNYFYIPHREETRGVGGIFFDHQDEKCGLTKEKLFEFCCELALNFPKIYSEQVNFNRTKPFSEKNIEWRNHRRGRYVEFNLVNDRGTKFGLFSGGRTESILMSLPPLANWTYQHSVDQNSDEFETLIGLKKDIDWINI